MPDVFRVAALLVEHAIARFPGQVAIIAYYGSHAKGTATASSDLDLFYIPDDGQAGALSSQFVYDGLPYDFWPISWAFAEDMANARPGRPWARAASLIADAKVLYARSPADRERFDALQRRVTELMQPDQRGHMLERAREALREAFTHLGHMHIAGADRLPAKRFLDAVANSLALANQTYFAKGWESDPSQVERLPRRPDGFGPLAHRVLIAGDLAAADALAEATRRVLLDPGDVTPAPAAVADVFRDVYPFVPEFVNKVLTACAGRNALAAAVAALQLQDEIARLMRHAASGSAPNDLHRLDEIGAAYAGAGLPDLAGPALAGDFGELARRARALDERLRAWLTERGAAVNVLESEPALRAFLAERADAATAGKGDAT